MKKNKLYFVAMLLVGLVAFASCKKNNPDTPKEPQTEKYSLTVTPVSIGSTEATIKVTPNAGNEGKYYVAFLLNKETFEKNGGKEGIHEWQMSWWNRAGEEYFHTNMMAELTKGEKVFDLTKAFHLSMLRWDCDYVFFAMGIDTVDGGQLTEVFTHEFHTPKGNIQSDNQFTVTLGTITHDAVEATITTTNNDPYMVRCERKSSFVDWYRNKPETELIGGQKPLDAMIYNIMDSYFGKTLEEEGVGRFPIYQGNKQFNRNDQILLSPNREYTMVIVGFDKGLTTAIKYVDFKTAPAP